MGGTRNRPTVQLSSKQVLALMRERAWKLEDLVRKSDLSQSTLKKILNEEKPVDIGTAQSLASALGIELGQLTFWIDENIRSLAESYIAALDGEVDEYLDTIDKLVAENAIWTTRGNDEAFSTEATGRSEIKKYYRAFFEQVSREPGSDTTYDFAAKYRNREAIVFVRDQRLILKHSGISIAGPLCAHLRFTTSGLISDFFAVFLVS